ncbi:MAG: histidine kinase, partial [Alistipes sp.]|nr:histidine kinase [Alistipes sp.]
MKLLNYKRSTSMLNLLIAIVITITVNFSYLLSMMVEQREAGEQRTLQEQESQRKPEIDGVLRISRDGYGYVLISDSVAVQRFLAEIEKIEQESSRQQNKQKEPIHKTPSPTNHANGPRPHIENQAQSKSASNFKMDSIFVNSRRIYLYKLKDGDTIRCTIHPPRGNSNPSVDEIILQNGVEATPISYDRPSREHEALIQLLYYMILSFLLLSIMTLHLKGYNSSTRQYIQRCAIALAVTFGCYFCAPYVNWYTGKMVMIFQGQQMMDWMVILKCTVVLAVAILYGRIYDLLSEQQKILLENEHLRTENLQTRYNMLMGQINPHFFFNSLNSLSMLVREQNEQKALEYIDQLSYTFRYIIQNGQNQKSTLEEEIEFARAYSEIFKVRYADKLFFDIEIDPQYNQWTLPSLTLQPLIGN